MDYELLSVNHFSDNRIPSILNRFFDTNSHSYNGLKFCVSSGMQRDLKNNSEFKPSKEILEVLKMLVFYPKNTTLRKMAEYLTSTVVSSKTNYKAILQVINTEIKKINSEKISKHNFLGNDYFALTAAGGTIENGNLTCFNIGNSNILVLNKSLEPIFETEDDISKYTFERARSIECIEGVCDDEKEFRSSYRFIHRNSYSSKAFGALTGERLALDHIHYYDVPLKDAEYIMAYTEGYIDILNDPKALSDILTKQKVVHPIGEGTLLSYRKK